MEVELGGVTKSPLLHTHWPLVGERVLPPPRASVALGVGSSEGPWLTQVPA